MAKGSKPKKEYQEFVDKLCESHKRKCLTTKCPRSTVGRKRVIGRAVHQLMEQEGWAYEQIPQQKS